MYSPLAYDARVLNAISGKSLWAPNELVIPKEFIDDAVSRLNRYAYNQRFYNGQHYLSHYEDGEERITLNYCSTIVEKSVEWLVAKGVTVSALEGNESVADIINQAFKRNDMDTLLTKAASFGAIKGDAFIYADVRTTDDLGAALPRNKWWVQLTALDPTYVFPFWEQTSPDKMVCCVIQYPMTSLKHNNVILRTTFITADRIMVWEANQLIQDGPNPLGQVNVVHIPNILMSGTVFGKADLDDVIPINVELNNVSNSIRRIVKYHGEPTTIVIGATISELEKGAKKMWSGIPVDGDVKNLELNSDLTAIYEWFNKLRVEIACRSGVPLHVMEGGGDAKVSNTSGIAMQMLYQPLIDKTDLKHKTYSKGLIQLGGLIIDIHEKILGEPISQLADHPERAKELYVDFTSLLPKDEQLILDTAEKKIAAGIWSQAEAIRQVSNVPNLERLSLELAADARAKLAIQAETARATQGMPFNPGVVFLGSPYLTQNFVDLAAAQEPEEPAAIDPSSAPVSKTDGKVY